MNKCPLCPEYFQSYFALGKHMEDYHYHKCVECGKAFVYKETLMNHMKKHHEDEESDGESSDDTFTYDDVRAILRYHRKHSV